MQRTTLNIFFFLLAVLLLGGCEKKFNLNDLPDAGDVIVLGDTSYVEVFPPWGGFSSPGAIIIGDDQLLYIADYERNEVVMMDLSGTILARKSIPHPTAIAMNYKLDLYVCGETLSPNKKDTIGAIYRIYLVRFDTTYTSRIDTIFNPSTNETTYVPIIRDTSYFSNHDIVGAPTRIVFQEPANPGRRFVGIGVLPGNEYLVARTGTDNTSFVDPDSRVLIFNNKDVLVTPIGDLITRSSGGSFITDINQLSGLTTFPASRDFVLLQDLVDVSYGAIWMVYQHTAEFDGWVPKFDPAKPAQSASDFIRVNRFSRPTAVAIDKRRRDIFIVDAALDTLVKFDRTGKFKSESFGRVRSASNMFPGIKSPRGVAFSSDCTLFISDTGNKWIRRFKLSTQTQCN
jgi:hypothetical protein